MAHFDILFVCKDVTPASYMRAMLPTLNDQTIAVMLEPGGAAAREFTDFSADHVTFITPTDEIDYDLLVVGCSTGNVLELDMLKEAKVLSKPTVAICDLAYAFKRHGETLADHYLVPNLWSAQGLTVDHTVVGDINAAPLPSITNKQADPLREWVDDSEIVFWLAQLTIEPLEMILARLQTYQKVLMGLHPDPKKWPDQTFIEHMMEQFGPDRVNTVANITKAGGVEDVNSDMAISAFHSAQLVVVTGYSGGGTKARYSGYRVLTADEPKTRQMFADENGVKLHGDFLLPSQGLSNVIRPSETGDLFETAGPVITANNPRPKSFAANLAAQVLRKMMRD